jgi:hypothetical protein
MDTHRIEQVHVTVMFYTCTRQVLDSSLGHDTGEPD